MNKFALCIAFLSVAVIAGTGCQKTKKTTTNPTVNSIDDIKVPAGFTWQNSHSVNFSVAITDTRFGTSRHTVAIYDGNPNAGGNLLSQGSATTATPFTSNINIPNTLTEVYIVKTAPDNSKIISRAGVAGTTASLSFGATDPSVNPSFRLANSRITADCNSGCTQTITTGTNNVAVNDGDVICITGNNITVGFSNINGGTIRVCGANVTLQNVNLGGSSKLLVTASGSVILSSLNFNSAASMVQNDGTFTYGGSFPDNGIFTNTGTFTCSGDFNLNSNASTFLNNGTMTISGNYNNSTPLSGSVVNSGSMVVTGAFQQNASAAPFVNNCSLRVNGNYNQNSAVRNLGFIKVLGLLTINSSTELSLYNGSMVSTNGFMSNAPVKGYGGTSLLKITGAVTVNSGGGVTDAVMVSSTNAFSTSYLSNGATLGSTIYIPTNGCNGEGNGTPAVTDADGDGVSDVTDAYPNDPAKAYNNYYPSSTGYSTVAFEDQWPAKGDYDLNDLVMSYQYKVVTSAANNVVQVVGNYTLYATGGGFGNAFAVQFPVAAGKVAGLSGGTLQTGQTNAVVELFSNMRNEMANWNTVPGAATSPAKNYTVTFNVTAGPSLSTFGLSSYNPFIFRNGLEIHLPAHMPTDKADQALFGTEDDNTNISANRYYVTKTGLPYALDIPLMPFKYPVEDTDITKAYLHFADWAQSAGSSYADWYSNTAAGYRNAAFIYNN